MALVTNLPMVRGDTMAWDVTIRNSVDDTTITLVNGMKIWFTVKSSYNDPDNRKIIQKTTDTVITNPANGIYAFNPGGGVARITLLPDDTNKLAAPVNLVYDIQFKDSAGN